MQTTGVGRAPATDVDTLLTTTNAILQPSTTVEVRQASGPMADMARHSLLHTDTEGTHLTNWTLDF